MTTTSETKYLTCAETAKLMRAALKVGFPGVKFSVRSDTYAGGASIRVSWTDGPFVGAVEKVARRYEGASFDGMIDLKSYHSDLVAFDGDEMPTEVHFGSDYVFTDRDLSPAYVAALTVEAAKVIDQNASSYKQGWGESQWYDALGTDFGTFQGGNGYSLVRFLSQHIAP